MMKIYVKYICMPFVLVGALCYSVYTLFSFDVLHLFLSPVMVKVMHIMTGTSVISIIINNITRDNDTVRDSAESRLS